MKTTIKDALVCAKESLEHIALSIICLFFAVYALVFCGICKLCGLDIDEDFE